MRRLPQLVTILLVPVVLGACSTGGFAPTPNSVNSIASVSDVEPISKATDEAVPTSPKAPWGEFSRTEDHGGHPWWAAALLWVPNRLLDFVDVFRVDVGVGPAAGGVVRVTEFAQLGYRQMLPFSLRVGDFGRAFPAIIERSNEIGAGPAFLQSRDREVCPGEIGIGADLFIAGAYGGICVDEVADFLLGLFFVDFKRDDI